MLGKIKKSIDFINKHCDLIPEAGLILGTGLGNLANEIKTQCTLNYADIPYFPLSTVQGHDGKLIIGYLEGKVVATLKGRFHYYEGYSMEEITYPVRTLKYLGINHLLLSNACGGINPAYKVGDLMIIEDHINLMPNPLIGKHTEEFGPRFPDMSEAYDKELISKAEVIARTNSITLHKGCYVAVSGPTLETPAEYKFFRIIGGDVVGMSTVPEVITARQMNIPCFAVSVVTDLGVPGKIMKITHEDVQAEAQKAEPELAILYKNLIRSLI